MAEGVGPAAEHRDSPPESGVLYACACDDVGAYDVGLAAVGVVGVVLIGRVLHSYRCMTSQAYALLR